MTRILVEGQQIRIKRCRHALFMYNCNDVYIGRSLERYGEYSEGENDVFIQILRPGMVALDVGANIRHSIRLA
jgi:hypothetical protein